MRRRDFIGLIVCSIAASSRAALAQQPRIRRVGVLINTTEFQPYVTAFVSELHKLGWTEDQNIHIDIRWNEGNAERARDNAAELVGLAPDVLMAASTTNVMALRHLTSSIPIVFVQVSDPVAQGLVANMTRPGGNITGFSNFEFSIGGKWVELLREAVPTLKRIAVMSNPDTSPQTKYFLRAIEGTAAGYGIQVITVPVRTDAEINQAIEMVARQPDSAIIMPTDSFLIMHLKQIAELAARYRVPTVSGNSDSSLLYYGSAVDLVDQYRQAAGYVDRILKGANPANLPIQLSTRFRLVINSKVAKSLGINLPTGLLVRADEVIE